MKRFVLTGLLLIATALGLAGQASAAYVKHADVSYALGSPPAPAPASLNQLDVYVPADLPASAHRPVVVYVHGGGWMRGDKSNKAADKARLFTDAGYVYVSINYRLSPVGGNGSDPDRVKFPDHPNDVGEAIGWLDRHVSGFGGDPGRMVLLGHSAGAQLVSLAGSDPSYYRAYGVSPAQILGVIPLDGIFDITLYADPSIPINTPDRTDMYWNAFGTPAENAATNSWFEASPINFADPSDPAFLFVAQQSTQFRQGGDYAMAQALGQSPDSVLLEPLDHEGINSALGDPADTTGETQAVLSFVQRVIAEAGPPVVGFRRRPPRVVRTRRHFARVAFAFSSPARGTRFECRLDGGRLRPCRSPRVYNVRRGKHALRVRATVTGRMPGRSTLARFRVLGPRHP